VQHLQAIACRDDPDRVDRRLDSLEDPIRFGPGDVPQWHAPVARANLSVGQLSVAQMCQAAVEQSDNTCATLLLKRIGVPRRSPVFGGDR
jgi:beta-lactamase class A